MSAVGWVKARGLHPGTDGVTTVGGQQWGWALSKNRPSHHEYRSSKQIL